MAHTSKIPQIVDFFFKHLRILFVGLTYLMILTVIIILLCMILYFTYSITGNRFLSAFTLGFCSYFIGKIVEDDLL